MTKYWIKLYHEILDDPKMGKLPDRYYRRVIELFLLAGEINKGGHLPPVDDMAWRLRLDPVELLEELQAIEPTGIVSLNDDGWIVTKFAERQDADTDAERKKHQRERERIVTQYVTKRDTNRDISRHENVTTDVQDIDIDIDKNKNQEAAASGLPDAVIAERIFQAVTGMISLPSSSRGEDIRRILDVYAIKQEQTIPYLMDFFTSWRTRNYSKSNTNWLDWALAGEVPKQRDKDNGRDKIDPRNIPTEIY